MLSVFDEQTRREILARALSRRLGTTITTDDPRVQVTGSGPGTDGHAD